MRMKNWAEQNRKNRSFSSCVFTQRSLATSIAPKLVPRNGPFEIMEKIGAVAYHLNFPATVKIHPVFHVSVEEVRQLSGCERTANQLGM